MLRRMFRPESVRIKNTVLLEYADVQQQLNYWTIPPVRPTTIYGHGIFELRSSMTIKTIKLTESIEQNDK